MSAIVAIVGACLLIAFGGPRINEANYDRIQCGMSRQQVEAILGQSNVPIVLGNFGVRSHARGAMDEYWAEPESGIVIVIGFDDRGTVAGKAIRAGPPMSMIELLQYRWEWIRDRQVDPRK